MTRNGAPAAALVPIDEYEALEETAEILSDLDALSALEVGLAEIDAIEDALGLLERDPFAGYALQGKLRGLYSLRVGPADLAALYPP